MYQNITHTHTHIHRYTCPLFVQSQELYALGMREIYDQCKIRGKKRYRGERERGIYVIYTCKYIHIFTHMHGCVKCEKSHASKSLENFALLRKRILSRHTFLCYIVVDVSLDRVSPRVNLTFKFFEITSRRNVSDCIVM